MAEGGRPNGDAEERDATDLGREQKSEDARGERDATNLGDEQGSHGGSENENERDATNLGDEQGSRGGSENENENENERDATDLRADRSRGEGERERDDDKSDRDDSDARDRDDDERDGDDSKARDRDDDGREESDAGDQRELEQEGETEGRAARKPEGERDEGREDERERDGDEEEEGELEERERPGPAKTVLVLLGTVVFVVLGFLLFSALIAPTYIAALILAVVWFVIAYLLLHRFLRGRPHLGLLVRGAFAAVVAAIVIWLAISTLTGKTVHEGVVTGQKLSQVTPTARVPEKPQKKPPQRNILVAQGKFKGAGAGSASGNAALVKTPDGKTVLTITKLDVTGGPTLHVLLAPHDGKDTSHALDLGKLKGNKGDEQYDVPPMTDISALHTVVINSSILSVAFARAELKSQ